MQTCFMLARVCTPSSLVRERERGRYIKRESGSEREGESGREIERGEREKEGERGRERERGREW